MKKKSTTKAALRATTEVETRHALRARLLDAGVYAARIADELPTDKADDEALLKAARYAQREAGSFEEMFNTVTTVNGTIEVLFQMIRPSGRAPKNVNWTVVCDLLDDARRRLGPVYSATAKLRTYERDIEEEARDAQIILKAEAIIAARESA